MIKAHRIQGFLLRHWYEVAATIDRKVDMFFWPTVDLLGFGLLTVYINRFSPSLNFASAIIGGLILWSLVYSIQRDITVSLLEDAWSRNLYNLFSSPLSKEETVVGALILSTLKALITMTLLSIFAWGLFDFNILSYGLPILLLLFNIFLFGWAFGFITSSLILRFGTKVQIFAWSLIAILYPISGVYYPLNVLPEILQKVAAIFPISYIFEAMRGIIISGTSPKLSLLLMVLALNLVYLAIGIFLFFSGFKHAKSRGWFIHPS